MNTLTMPPVDEPLASNTERLLTSQEVAKRTGYTREWIRRLMVRGHFPPAYRVGHRGLRWRESEINQWIANLPPARQALPDSGQAMGLLTATAGRRGKAKRRARPRRRKGPIAEG